MTLSFDASVKVKTSNFKGYVNHIARDVDEQNGVIHSHSNRNIHPELTKYNQTMIYDAATDDFVSCTDAQQIEQVLKDRLKAVKKPLRSDAVVVRGLVLQLDKEFYENADEDAKYKSLDDMSDWLMERFGKKNIIAMSLHEDETSPHLHIAFCPVTEDGRLSQKDWFDKPSTLAKMHKEFREHMIDRGYDVDMENKPKRKRMSDKDYRDYKELEKANEELDDTIMEMQAESQIAQMLFNQERSEELGELAYLQSRTARAKRFYDREGKRLQDAVSKADGIVKQLEAYEPNIQYGENVVVDAIRRMAPTTYERTVKALGLDAQKIVQKQIEKPRDSLSELKREYGINSRETDRFMNENSQRETDRSYSL